MKTTYLVSGFMRCGTSMMMHALSEGGLEPVYNPNRDQMIDHHGDEHYRPNPALYELHQRQYQQPRFPKMYEGRLIKCLMGGIADLWPAGDYRVVFMRRLWEEVRQSYEAFTGGDLGRRWSRDGWRLMTAKAIRHLRVRRDVGVTLMWYRHPDRDDTVMADPVGQFTRLREAGWPIDVEACAAVVEPELCRFRRERLTVGI